MRTVLGLIFPGKPQKPFQRPRLVGTEGCQVAFELRLEFALSHRPQHIAPKRFKALWQVNGNDMSPPLGKRFLSGRENRIHLRVCTFEVCDDPDGLAFQ
ncbi:hypothetical protein D3C84_779560 [compost metagenome]